MHQKDIKAVTIFENQFWLQVLGDHARFIFDSLAPSEIQYIQRAQYFITIFDSLLNESRKPLTDEQLKVLTNQAYYYAQEIRAFKLDIIKIHLIGDIKIQLPPTFLNHMVNEVEEYIRVLSYLLMNQIPPNHPIYLHLLWLLDAAGHASAISGDLDMVEKQLIKKSEKFMENFEDFYIKSVEMAGYMRTCLDRYPALDRFNNQVELEITLFKKFLKELEGLEICNKVLGTLFPLLLDHMYREECYYLIKLAESSNVTMPDCDPTKPRSE
ncbi:DUF2935 domain-containing protein [Serpentinicella alkaliphila]|uniref:DUF2935 family protein n=1 Tax=Serpentinicella alkaliphila TaxID=1734049 RepID=A0A4R2TLY6_9FIRM|nr:DUF2935 domain-containing protein [Serpentinicella alkaliphila]QUH24562.1 DUF2935 domain-containing protein [Serpentinicella alkaliphila]TCQ04658.1 DUF2935 family protein [Serpentinicella alkaliphila]